mmetsp:Transcript_16756/g.48651  ORF Transcript_16756/g.48651 Transcript_16756/m.48651 type:complete len:201 (-) Transcript_16756:425-1027(-)
MRRSGFMGGSALQATSLRSDHVARRKRPSPRLGRSSPRRFRLWMASCPATPSQPTPAEMASIAQRRRSNQRRRSCRQSREPTQRPAEPWPWARWPRRSRPYPSPLRRPERWRPRTARSRSRSLSGLSKIARSTSRSCTTSCSRPTRLVSPPLQCERRWQKSSRRQLALPLRLAVRRRRLALGPIPRSGYASGRTSGVRAA